MRPRRRNPKEATPLDNRQRALADEQAKLRSKVDQLERLIADAPRMAEEEEKRRREILITRASQGARRSDSSAALVDKRFDLHAQGAPRQKRRNLRSRQRAERLQFIVLCIVLAAIVLFVIKNMPRM